MIEKGLCQCGCGRKTNIASKNNTKNRHMKGQPLKFIYGHSARVRKHSKETRKKMSDSRKGKRHWNWKGGETKDSYGYDLIKISNHPRSQKSGYVVKHIIIAEKALGKAINLPVVVHHNRSEDCIDLVICQNQAYHLLLHQRKRALSACGHKNWRKCHICKKYDSPEYLYIKGSHAYHRTCRNQYVKTRHHRINALP
jgi:hypothetical protein